MENPLEVPQANERSWRDWLDPIRLYNPTFPVGRWTFLWGLVIYPFIVMFLLLTGLIIGLASVVPSAQLGDTLGIVVWVFMLAWVAAVVMICRRRLLTLGMSMAWVWLAILPVVNLALFVYLLVK